ncbi:MAG TPA: ATP-binding protein [Pyrinomonadaceae bacterium]|nr:ATP-binding protein [Pyrinomonadaceae bacterium]
MAVLAGIVLIKSPSLTSAILLILGLLVGSLLAKTPESQRTRIGAKLSEHKEHRADNVRSRREIVALRELFEATMGGMREGLLVVDEDLRVVASNAAARLLFNSTRDKLDSQRLTDLTRNPEIFSAFLEGLRGKKIAEVKVEMYGPTRRVFDLRVVPLNSGERDATQGAIGVFFDITQLEKLERVRQEFLSNVSHELRTPLTAILAFVETLEADTLKENEDNRRFLSIIRRNAARMHALIDDILELSAIEAGTVKLKAAEIRLWPLIRDILTALQAKAESKGLTVENFVPEDAVVFADSQRLEQMLTNLVDNAIKFNRSGGRLTIRFEEDERWTYILVQDTGEGIPAHHLERLFERFYRVDRARSREMGGTGLGLAIVKHLARAHGGDVSVKSRLGEGSVFAIQLPREQRGLPHLSADGKALRV